MHNIRRNKRVQPLFWTRVLLRFICRVDDGDAVAVGAGGREGDLRRQRREGVMMSGLVDASIDGAPQVRWTTSQQEQDKPHKVPFDTYL